MDEETLKSFEIYKKLERSKRIESFIKKNFEKDGGDAIDYDLTKITHGFVRYLKSVGLLYLKYLKSCRNTLSSKPNISQAGLQSVDNRISQMEEKINIGVFHGATPRPIVADDLEAASEQPEQESAPERLAKVVRPRPVVKPSVELLDTQLRERGLDLFDKFREDGKHERLDTVITEATRILED